VDFYIVLCFRLKVGLLLGKYQMKSGSDEVGGGVDGTIQTNHPVH